jgi:hypothetical protein
MITHGCSPEVPRQAGSSSTSQASMTTVSGVCAGQRRVWDSNPRGSSRPLAVFKTAAIGH